MKHAQKVALVPYEQVENNYDETRASPNQPLSQNPLPRDILKESLSSLDQKMADVLKNTSLSIEEKVMKYNTVLEEYLLFADKYYERENPTRPVQNREEIEMDTTPSNKTMDAVEGLIMTTLSRTYRQNAEVMLKHLRNSGTSWNKQGVVTHNGQIIEGSNINDLVHFVLRHRKKYPQQPAGLEQFKHILSTTNLPQDLVPWNKVFQESVPHRSPTIAPIQDGEGKIKNWDRY